MGKVRQINILFFTTTSLILKIVSHTRQKLTKDITKESIFTILGTSRLKTLMILKVFTAKIRCICMLIMKVDILKKKMEINI